MGMADREARMLAAVYRTYGRSAVWTPAGGGEPLTPVVRHVQKDVVEGFGQGESLVRSNVLYVRVSEVTDPRQDDGVEVSRPAGGVDTFVITADPRLEPDGLEWLCEAKLLG